MSFQKKYLFVGPLSPTISCSKCVDQFFSHLSINRLLDQNTVDARTVILNPFEVNIHLDQELPIFQTI